MTLSGLSAEIPALAQRYGAAALPYLSDGLLALGAFFLLTGAIGLFRMPDFFTRLHPSGVSEAMGLPLLALGLMLKAGWTLASLKIFLFLLFLLIASPTACHALARAAWSGGVRPLGLLADKEKK